MRSAPPPRVVRGRARDVRGAVCRDQRRRERSGAPTDGLREQQCYECMRELRRACSGFRSTLKSLASGGSQADVATGGAAEIARSRARTGIAAPAEAAATGERPRAQTGDWRASHAPDRLSSARTDIA